MQEAATESPRLRTSHGGTTTTPPPYVRTKRAALLGLSLVTFACATPPRDDERPTEYQWAVRSESNPYQYTHVGKAYATKAEAQAALDEHLNHFPWHRPHAEILRVPVTERNTRD